MSKIELNQIAASRDGRDITRGWLSPLMLAPVEDRILQERGGGDYRLYEDILRDDHVRAGVNQRAHGIIARPWEVQPGGKRAVDKQAADFLRETLDGLEWDRITLKMLAGVFYGFSVAEAMWVRDGRYVQLVDIKVRNRRRFGFDGNGRLRLRTFEQPMPGEIMPDRKFWAPNFGADHDDAPYGLGLAHYLYWPVWLKRNAFRFWAIYLEKFGTPTTVGKYPSGADPAEQNKLLQAAQAVQRDSAVTVPDGMVLELLEATRAGTADHAGFVAAMNEAILMICLGQTATTKGTAGALGGDGERERVKDAILKADADLLCASFNRTIATWLTQWNFPGAEPPQVWRVFGDEDLDKRVEREKGISEMSGLRPTQRHIEDTYGGEWEPAPEPAPQVDALPRAAAGAAARQDPDFAEGAVRFSPDQQAIEGMLSSLIPDATEVTAKIGADLDALIRHAKSFEDLKMLLLTAIDKDDTEMEDALLRGLVAADLHGQNMAGGDDAD